MIIRSIFVIELLFIALSLTMGGNADYKNTYVFTYEIENDNYSDEEVLETIEVLRIRLSDIEDEKVETFKVSRQSENQIIIKLSNNIDENIEVISEDLIRKVELKFVDIQGNIILTGKNVIKSEITYLLGSGEYKPAVLLQFDEEGTNLLFRATKELARESNPSKSTLYIVLDDKLISSPIVKVPIEDGRATINGNFTIEAAGDLATKIRSRSDDMLDLKVISVNKISK